MNKINKVVNNGKFGIVIVILLIIITLITGTYAWFTWSNISSENTSLTMTIGKFADVTFTTGNDINAGLTPVFNYFDGDSTTFSINNKDTTRVRFDYVVKLNITSIPFISNDSESLETLKSLKYVLLKGEKVVAEDSLSGVSNGDSIELYTGSMFDSGVEKFTFYIYIDGNMENPSSMINTTFVGELMVEASVVEEENFLDYITNLYMNASPTKATTANNGIYYYYAKSVGMMNDGMNSNHVWEDGVNTGNIRYYSASPSNYVDIGDRDSKGNVIPWRIIGVFKNITLTDGSKDTLVKVIRSEPLNAAGMQWDDDKNDWYNATLQSYLTGDYYAGLSQSVKDKIETVEWNLGGWNTSTDTYSNIIYQKERGTLKCSSCTYNTTWEGKIALMYPSDYGYATDLTQCTVSLNNYYKNNSKCTNKDWLSITDKAQWFLTPRSSNATTSWAITTTYFVSGGQYVYNKFAVRPVLYLKSNLFLVSTSGDGSSIKNAYVVR